MRLSTLSRRRCDTCPKLDNTHLMIPHHTAAAPSSGNSSFLFLTHYCSSIFMHTLFIFSLLFPLSPPAWPSVPLMHHTHLRYYTIMIWPNLSPYIVTQQQTFLSGIFVRLILTKPQRLSQYNSALALLLFYLHLISPLLVVGTEVLCALGLLLG